MAAPTRFPVGLTQAAKWQPLGEIGTPDPLFYAWEGDDFLPYTSANYTVTVNGAGGSIAATPGAGGRILFTTGGTPGNSISMQNTIASYQYTPGKKLGFLARIQLADNTNPYGVLGLIQTTTTPNTVTNGWYFSKAPGGTLILFTIVNASTVVGTVTVGNVAPANFDVDLGFTVDRQGNTNIFVGHNIEGALREDFATIGPTAKIPASSLTGALPTTLLNPTLSLTTITTVETGIVDFLYAAQER
jgi:hypothetical protein